MNRIAKCRVGLIRIASLLIFILTFRLTASVTANQTTSETADLILHHGLIWTVDESKPQAEAIAVRGDKILKVGGNEEALALKGERTRLIDLKGAFVTPGFNDSHVHFASAASFL